jgi:hypothetical protein
MRLLDGNVATYSSWGIACAASTEMIALHESSGTVLWTVAIHRSDLGSIPGWIKAQFPCRRIHCDVGYSSRRSRLHASCGDSQALLLLSFRILSPIRRLVTPGRFYSGITAFANLPETQQWLSHNTSSHANEMTKLPRTICLGGQLGSGLLPFTLHVHGIIAIVGKHLVVFIRS